MRKVIIIYPVLILAALYCNITYYKDTSEGAKDVIYLDGYGYQIKCSNIIISHDGKKMKIPIYAGTRGDMPLEKLERDMKDNGPILSNMYYPAKKGNVKTEILKMLAFYKTNLLQKTDIVKPTVIGHEAKGIVIWYDFKIGAVPCCMRIITSSSGKVPEGKLINDINVDEDSGAFYLGIVIGKASGF